MTVGFLFSKNLNPGLLPAFTGIRKDGGDEEVTNEAACKKTTKFFPNTPFLPPKPILQIHTARKG